MDHDTQGRAPEGRPQQPAPTQGKQGTAPEPEGAFQVEVKGLRDHRRAAPGQPASTIRLGEGKDGRVLAYVHVTEATAKEAHLTRPPFTLSAPDGALWCSVRTVGRGEYDVHGSDGAVIGRITRSGGRVLPWPRRAYWTTRVADGSDELTAKRGTVGGWTAWAVLGFPFYSVFWVLSLFEGLLSLLFGDTKEAKKSAAWDFGTPSRALWRRPGDPTVVIDYRGGGIFRLASPRLDHRLAHAQAVLHVWDGI